MRLEVAVKNVVVPVTRGSVASEANSEDKVARSTDDVGKERVALSIVVPGSAELDSLDVRGHEEGEGVLDGRHFEMFEDGIKV